MLLKKKLNNERRKSVGGAIKMLRPATLLEKNFSTFISFTLFEFIILQSWLFIFGKSVCNENYDRKETTIYVNALVAGAFIMTVFQNSTRLKSGVKFYGHCDIATTVYAIMCVSAIAACSTLTSLLSPNGTCTDYFGVKMNAETYPEWLATVPLLGFMSISVDSKASSSFEDKLFIGSLFLNILFGWLLIFPIINQSMVWSCLILFLSCFFYAIFQFLAEKMIWECHAILSEKSDASNNSFRIQLASHKILLVRFLTVLFPVFPIIYFLGVFKIIDENTVDASLLVASAFSKMIFATLCTDAKLEISHQSTEESDQLTYLRFMFHEIRSPLNSMSLGIKYMFTYIKELGTAPRSLISLNSFRRVTTDAPSITDTLTVLNDATDYMDNLLNNAFAMQKLTYDALKLIRKSFTIDSLISLAFEQIQEQINQKKLRLEVNTDYSIPLYVKGDKYQLARILAKVLSNAVKYSPKASKIILSIASPQDMYYADVDDYNPRTNQTIVVKQVPMRDYVFTIIDSGPGISKEKQDKIFSYDTQIIEECLGMIRVKNIIELIGGTLSCQSRSGRGTTFCITIPLETVIRSPREDHSDLISLTGNESVLSHNLSLISSAHYPIFLKNLTIPVIPSSSSSSNATPMYFSGNSNNSIALQHKMYQYSLETNKHNHTTHVDGDELSQMTQTLTEPHRHISLLSSLSSLTQPPLLSSTVTDLTAAQHNILSPSSLLTRQTTLPDVWVQSSATNNQNIVSLSDRNTTIATATIVSSSTSTVSKTKARHELVPPLDVDELKKMKLKCKFI